MFGSVMVSGIACVFSNSIGIRRRNKGVPDVGHSLLNLFIIFVFNNGWI